ncbi:peroxisome proliferator-activated receptor gamma coactivator-related protein 1 isoform X2 [Tachysurus fulvidraco]|nr:peroxisome proliferator-activated receptor gamma coactivator-related protein 1 isoform X2 [Tachysurus fulvidraco]
MRVNFKMAGPHGDRRRNLNTGFTEFATPDAFQDAQVGSSKSHSLEFADALGSTSGSFHSSLEPSILSIFEDSSAEEAKIHIDEESEASLLSAFSEMLDSVIEDTLSPFDTVPDSKLFMGKRCQESRVRLHCLDIEAAHCATRSFTPSNSKAETLISDRKLRPRLNRRTQKATVQRSDGEEEDLSETRRRPVRIFRIESDADMCTDEQQDGFLSVSLVELVRHMHPYSLRVAMDKKESLRSVEDLQDDDVFVDVVGDDDTEETPLGMSVVSNPSDLGSEQILPQPQSPSASSAFCNSSQVDMLKMCSLNCEEQKEQDDTGQRAFANPGSSRKIKKKVRFATDLASIHIYQVEHEAHKGDDPDASCSAEYTNDLKMADGDSQISDLSGNLAEVAKKTSPQNGNAKLKTLSLQEYRLLRQNTLPKEERKTDFRTKWPSVSKAPKELTILPYIPGYNSSQVNVEPPFYNTKTSTRGAVAKSRRNLHLPIKSVLKQNTLVRKPVQVVDPPNPVIVSLQPDPTFVQPLSKEQKLMQEEIGESQANRTNINPSAGVPSNSVTQEQPLMVLPEDSSTSCSLTMSGIVKTNISALTSPVTVIPVQTCQENRVQTPVTGQFAEKRKQGFAREIGIEATDVTSLLEQFETQGLTPPATPPHQIWNPLTPLKARQRESPKPSPSKTIQIIEPKPLPPSKIQSKSQPSLSIPAPSLFLAFIDHDYCSTQDFSLSKNRALSDVYMHNRSLKVSRNHTSHIPMDNRTSCEVESLSGSVLLSPESSPCRLEARRTGEHAETRSCSHCTCSQSPPARGRTRRRHYRKRYRDSWSSSRSPSCSSSASSCSPPRKRYRSRHSESSSSSSSRSSSQSLSPSPNRGRQRCYRRSQSRSFSRSRSRSHSPQSDWKQKWSSWKRQREYYHMSQGEDAYRAKQKAIEERRVVYVGRIRGTMTKDELRERFALFGKIEDCTVHFRSRGDNYGFVTYYSTDDAFTAIEKGTKLRQPDELPFDICFGGRRQFCRSDYLDLDSSHDMVTTPRRSEDNALDFDALLKQAQRGLKT